MRQALDFTNREGYKIMELIATAANGFMDLFRAGAATFTSWVTGIIPLLVIMMTAVNSLIKLIGEERVNGVAQRATQNIITRYTVLPVLAVLFLGNPMCYTFGNFVEQKYKPAYYDAAVSFVHGLPLGDWAVRYFIVGIVVILLRGIVTEKIYLYMKRREEKQA